MQSTPPTILKGCSADFRGIQMCIGVSGGG